MDYEFAVGGFEFWASDEFCRQIITAMLIFIHFEQSMALIKSLHTRKSFPVAVVIAEFAILLRKS